MSANTHYKYIILFLILIIIIGTLPGCLRKQNTDDVPVESGSIFAMDTLIRMKVYGQNAEEIIEDSFQRIKDIENKLSTTIKTSDIYLVNNNEQPVTVSDDTITVLKEALNYARISEGKFDPSIGPVVNLWGIGSKDARVPAPSEIKSAIKKVNYKWIKLNEKENSVTLLKEGMKLDLGGIAKGYAADEIRKIIQEGSSSAYINLGGNVLVVGTKPDGTLWNIGIQDPRKNRGRVMASIKTGDKTIVTSGNYERYFEKEGKLYHHILDPDTGKPARNNITSVSIVADNSLQADALSTGLYILGINKGMKLINKLDNIEALFITDNHRIYLSPGLEKKVEILDSNFKIAEGDSQ